MKEQTQLTREQRRVEAVKKRILYGLQELSSAYREDYFSAGKVRDYVGESMGEMGAARKDNQGNRVVSVTRVKNELEDLVERGLARTIRISRPGLNADVVGYRSKKTIF